MSEPRYSITVHDVDRRRHRPLACHTDLTCRAAFELASVYRALGHAGQHIAIEREVTKRKELAS